MERFIGCALLLISLITFSDSFSQANLYYRTKAGSSGSGDWSNASIWEVNTTPNGTYSNATVPPNSTSAAVTIRSGRNVTVSTSVSAKLLTMGQGGNASLNITSNGTLTIADDGTGATDFTVANGSVIVAGSLTLNSGSSLSNGGTITVTGTISNSGSITGTTAANTSFQSGGRYRHLLTTEGVIPLATWNVNSTMEIAGYTGSINASALGNWSQSFGNVEINCTGLGNGGIINLLGRLNTITGNLSVLSTGGASSTGKAVLCGPNGQVNVSGNFSLSANQRVDQSFNGGNWTLSIGGNFTNSGTFNITTGTGSPNLIINGSLNNSGTFTFTSSTGSPNLTLRSDLTNNGTLQAGAGGTFIFDGNTLVSNTGTISLHNLTLNATRSLTIPELTISLSGNMTLAATSTFNHLGTFIINGTIDQALDINGKEIYTIEVNKGSGVVNLISQLLLVHLLDFPTAGTLNSNGNLVIQSKGNTTDLDASIGPMPIGTVINGNVTVQRYLHAFGFAHNRYIAVSMSGITPSAQFSDDFAVASGSIRSYDETVAGVMNNGYVDASIASSMQRAVGYLAWMYTSNADMTVDIVGGISQGSVAMPVSYTSTSGGPGHDGWNLLGNPYPSSIRWSNDPSAWTLTNIQPTVYVTDMLSKTFKVFNYSDNSGEGGIIAMGQAFWVKANAASPSVTIHEQAKTSDGNGSFYRKSLSKSEQLVLSIRNTKFEDKSYLKINADATENFDESLDAYKLKNDFLNIYFTDKENSELVMNTFASIPEGEKIPIVVEAKEAGDYEISFSNIEKFSPASTLYLIDAQEREVIPVSSGMSYTINIYQASTPVANRLYLSTNSELPKYNLSDWVQTYPNPVKDVLHIQIPSSENLKIALFDLRGQHVLSYDGQGLNTIDLVSLPVGIYMLKVFNGKETVTRKILKQ